MVTIADTIHDLYRVSVGPVIMTVEVSEVESVGSVGGSVWSVGKAVVNGMNNYFSATQTDKSYWSCGSVVFPHKSAKCKTAIDVATIFTLEQV